MMFSRQFAQQQLVEYAADVLRIISLGVVIGLTLTAITGCRTSDDPSSTVASDAKESASEKSEVVSPGQDCVTVDKEMAKQNEYTRDNGIEIRTQEWFDEALKTWARIWPQMNDPDLKSIFRELANTTDADDDAMDNWIAYRTICDTDSYG